MTDAKPTEATCTIRAEFVGIPLAPCGKPAEVATEGRCPNGHVRRRWVCAGHTEAFKRFPQQVFCEQCDDAGIEAVSTLTIGGAA